MAMNYDATLTEPDDARYCERCEAFYHGKHCASCAGDALDRLIDERKEERHE